MSFCGSGELPVFKFYCYTMRMTEKVTNDTWQVAGMGKPGAKSLVAPAQAGQLTQSHSINPRRQSINSKVTRFSSGLKPAQPAKNRPILNQIKPKN